ncbi:MAG: putative DNA-binding protein [Clostridia bacterium]|nr:putative DNA-binding protein [Clostridia bacterium]
MASKNLNISSLLDLYGGMLTEKQQSFLEYYYNDDLSLSEIAQNEGITRQGVYDIIKRASDQLINYENKLKLNDRFQQINKQTDDILNGKNPLGCAENIKKIINFEED